MEILRELEQGSDEWKSIRIGRMTASHAKVIQVSGKGLETYCRQLAAERYTGKKQQTYASDAMRVGIEEEHFARDAYSLITGNEVEQIGFAILDDYVGCSPDGLIGDDGGIEIKRKTFGKHADLLFKAVEFEQEYIWQCHMNMLILDRQWWDLVSFNPDFKENSLIIKRILRSREADKQLLDGFENGKKIIDNYLNILYNGNN